MLRQANDIVGQILLVVLWVVMGGVPLGVLVLGVINFIRAETRRGTIVLQILASLLVWTLLTGILLMILMVIIFSYEYPLSPTDEMKGNAAVLIGTVVHGALGAALIYWTWRQAKLSTARPQMLPAKSEHITYSLTAGDTDKSTPAPEEPL